MPSGPTSHQLASAAGAPLIEPRPESRPGANDAWPPTLHGTGTEDYFNHAWGMQRQAYAYHGAIVHEGDVPGYAVSYRFHVVDPIRFAQRIRVSIEHGHANHLSDDWASTAYWYQVGDPAALTITPVNERLPLRPEISTPVQASNPPNSLAAEVEAQRQAKTKRERSHEESYAKRIEEATTRAAQQEAGNRAHARDLRRRFG